jgi:hypothetical protein
MREWWSSWFRKEWRGEDLQPSPSPARADFAIMMECTPVIGNCHSVCTLWVIPWELGKREFRGRILGHKWEKSFLPCYLQSPQLKSGLKLVSNVNIVWKSQVWERTSTKLYVLEFGFSCLFMYMYRYTISQNFQASVSLPLNFFAM